jgi:ribosomal protein L30/L7E
VKIKLIQTKSSSKSTKKQLGNLKSLKLGKIGRCSYIEDNSSSLGRLKIVQHLVRIEKC